MISTESELKNISNSLKNIELRIKYIEQYVQSLWELRENVIQVTVDHKPMIKKIWDDEGKEEKKPRKPKKPKLIGEEKA